MSLLLEYIQKLKNEGAPGLESELLKLIKQYNQTREKFLFVYAAAIGKRIPAVPLDQSDYYVFHDLLTGKPAVREVDVYVETPGGSGEAAEEIVRFLHNNFETVSFLVSGEAKSAGTIMVLSGHEILMTETGSLGPIDAQMQIGRSTISAYDYMEWVNEKRGEAVTQGKLNPFDATMVAQITPGELGTVLHALQFAKDLVIEWLTKYKFGKWTQTETQKIPVTEEMKTKRAGEIAEALIDRSRWQSHGRSIKIRDLERIGLKIKKVQEAPVLSGIVYRIQTVCRLLFDSSGAYKIYATADEKIVRQATLAGGPITIPIPQPGVPDVVQIRQNCPNCPQKYSLYGKFSSDPKIDQEFRKRGFISFPKEAKIKCTCGFEIDLLGLKNQIEIESGKKLIH